MKQKISLLFFSILISCGVYSQGETANWYFGTQSGMLFPNMTTRSDVTINGVLNQTLSGIPTFEVGPINTNEGCFSISDKEGNFLFASNGIYVYNKNKALMNHGSGLKGDPSATQSGIVIPRPKHPNNYYIVTAPALETVATRTYGLFYYEVDMTQDSGQGDVLGPYNGTVPIGTELNFDGIYTTNLAYENVAAVGHGNGVDFWLIHRCQNHFFVWLVTENGIDPTPAGHYVIGDNPGAVYIQGYLRFSADGRYIASACPYLPENKSTISVANFDIDTGVISGIATRTFPGDNTKGIYGLEFSPSNEYVYYTYAPRSAYTQQGLMRVSLSSLLNGVAETPLTLIDQTVGAIQIGPDSRIYGISSNYSTLGNPNYRNLYVIPNPNDMTPDVAIIPNYFPAANGSHLSLPTFTSSFFSTGDITSDPGLPACVNTEVTLSIQITAGSGIDRVAKLEWDFGDVSGIVTENDMNQYDFVQKHTYTKPGKYTLTITPYKGDGSIITDKIKTLEVKISRCVLPVNHNISVWK